MERAVVEYLANALWQAPLLVAAVAALLWALGADVRTRHRVWLAVLVVAMLLPVRGMDHGAAPRARIVTMSPAAAPAPSIGAPHGPRMATPADDVDFPVTRAEEPMHRHGIILSPAATRWIVRLYGALLAFFAWRVLRAWIAAQGLLRRSRSIDLAPRAMAIFAQAAESADVPLPRLRQSDETVSPVVIGAAKPVLLLPAGFDRLKDDEILAALSHEFAHLARRDYLVNLICQIGTLPLAWHPAILYVHKRIRDTREMLCDAAAAQEMASPVRYATCLVAFALRALDGHDAALATQGLSMFDNRILEERILQLTQAPETPEPSTRLARLAGASIGLLVAVAMALLLHITPTWADTPPSPVQLTPPIDLPVIPAAPDAPAAPAAPPAPAVPAAPSKPRHVVVQNDDDTKRAIAEEERERADRKREQAQLQRDEAQRQRDEAQRQREDGQRQREAARQDVERQREVAQQRREEAQRQREAAHEEAGRQRELAQQQREQQQEVAERRRELAQQVAEQQREQEREVAEQQRQSSREAIEEARRGAVDASRAYAAEIKRQVAEAMKAGQAVQDVDMEKIRQEIAQATASVHTPEFRQQMSDLQNHLQQLQDNMSQLRAQMKSLNHEVERSVNSPM